MVERPISALGGQTRLSHEEIAESTESTVLAVRSRLHRARLRLRERLAQRFGDQP